MERQLVGTSDDRCPSYAVSSRSVLGRRQKRDLAEELEVLRHCFKSEHQRINMWDDVASCCSDTIFRSDSPTFLLGGHWIGAQV